MVHRGDRHGALASGSIARTLLYRVADERAEERGRIGRVADRCTGSASSPPLHAWPSSVDADVARDEPSVDAPFAAS